MSGKGDNPRPLSVTPEQFAERFDAIDWNAREREANRRLNESEVIAIYRASGWHAEADAIERGEVGVIGFAMKDKP